MKRKTTINVKEELAVDRKFSKLQREASRIVSSSDNPSTNTERLSKLSRKLNRFRIEKSSQEDLLSGVAIEEFLLAVRKKPELLQEFIPSQGENKYIDVVEFFLEQAPNFLYLLLRMKPSDGFLQEKDIFSLAWKIGSLSSFNNQKNSAMLKVRSLSMKSSNLTASEFQASSKLGSSVTLQTVSKTVSHLASLSEIVDMKKDEGATIMSAIDNMDMKSEHKENHFTLPVTIWDRSNTSHLDKENRKSFGEVLELWTLDTFDITADINQKFFEAFKYIVYHQLATLIMENFNGFNWLKAFYPPNHDHEFAPTSKEKTDLKAETPYFLSENSIPNMIIILQRLINLYLRGMAQRVEDKAKFESAVSTMRSDTCDEEELHESEEYVMSQCKEHGFFHVFGDQLTIARIRSAVRAMKGSVTVLGRFDLLHCAMLGWFHIEMNFQFQLFTDLMPSLSSVNDTLSLAWFRLLLPHFDHISNEEHKIKKPSLYEANKQFGDVIGDCFLVEMLKSSIYESCEKIDETEEGAEQLFERILEQKKIRLFFRPEAPSQDQFYDSVDLNAAEMASRRLLGRVLKQAERQGDANALHALRIILVAFFFNAKGFNSNYAPDLANNVIEYLKESEREQARLDLMACVNLTGQVGCCMAIDKMVETKVRAMKGIFRGMHQGMNEILIEKLVSAGPIIDYIQGNDLEALDLAEFISGGGKHSRTLTKEAEKARISEEISKLAPFNSDQSVRKEKVYNQPIKRMFEDLTKESYVEFICKKKDVYSKHMPHHR